MLVSRETMLMAAVLLAAPVAQSSQSRDAAALRAHFETHGFATVPALLSPDEVNAIHDEVDALVANDEFGPSFAVAQRAADAGAADAPILPGEFSLEGMPVGSLVLVDHFTLHGSGPNTANRRRVASLGFAGPRIHTTSPLEAVPKPARNIAVLGARGAREVVDYYSPPEWEVCDVT